MLHAALVQLNVNAKGKRKNVKTSKLLKPFLVY